MNVIVCDGGLEVSVTPVLLRASVASCCRAEHSTERVALRRGDLALAFAPREWIVCWLARTKRSHHGSIRWWMDHSPLHAPLQSSHQRHFYPVGCYMCAPTPLMAASATTHASQELESSRSARSRSYSAQHIVLAFDDTTRETAAAERCRRLRARISPCLYAGTARESRRSSHSMML